MHERTHLQFGAQIAQNKNKMFIEISLKTKEQTAWGNDPPWT